MSYRESVTGVTVRDTPPNTPRHGCHAVTLTVLSGCSKHSHPSRNQQPKLTGRDEGEADRETVDALISDRFTAKGIDSVARKIAEVESALVHLFDRHARVALAFSGGKDSLALLRLCLPWRDRITVLWVNTGSMFPHMIEFVRRSIDGWAFVELRSDMLAFWQTYGMPASVVPTAHVVGGRGEPKRPLIVMWQACCHVVRGQPLFAWLREHPDMTALLHGQRNSDEGRFSSGQMQPQTAAELIAPLWNWTNGDVAAYVHQHAIELPEQYAAGWHDSGECWPCTALVKPERMTYMRQRYPEQAAVVERRARAIYETAIAAARLELQPISD